MLTSESYYNGGDQDYTRDTGHTGHTVTTDQAPGGTSENYHNNNGSVAKHQKNNSGRLIINNTLLENISPSPPKLWGIKTKLRIPESF